MADEGLGVYAGAMPSKDPYAGINAVTNLTNNLVQTQRNELGLEREKVELASQQLGHMRGMLSDLLGSPDAGRTDMTKAITERAALGAKMGLFTPAQVVEGLKGLPTNPREQYQWLQTHLSSIQSAQEKMNSFFGAPVTEGVGGGSVTTQTPQMPGLPVRVRRTQQYSLPPDTRGVVESGPNRGAEYPVGSPQMQMPQQGPDSMQPVPLLAPGQRAPAAGAPPRLQDSRPQAAPAPQAPAPRVMTKLPTGVARQMEASTDSYAHAQEAAGKYAQRINPLRQVIPMLETMKETDLGPGSDRLNEVKSFLTTLGAGRLAGVDPEKIRDYNEVKKYLSQYSAQAAATLGPKTNEGLATAVTSNPNVHMDRLSALELSKIALGIERMQQVGVLEFENAVRAGKAAPGGFNTFMVNWATKQDPRAFVYDLMDKKAQEKVRKLPDAERAKVRNAMMLAQQYGVLGDVHRGQ